MDLLHDSTVKEILYNAVEKLKMAGIKESRSEAEIILAHIMSIERWKLYLKENDVIALETRQAFFKAIELREKRCPVAYVINKKEFYGFDFFVSPQVLIPRPETEFLIDAVVGWVKDCGKNEGENLNIVDLGTGSGSIAITLALLLPRSSLWAVDISPSALKIAKKNARFHGIENRINFIEGSYWEPLAANQPSFDVIVSNPPYICRHHIESLSPEVKEYEPRKALDGGEDGLDAYRQILKKLNLFVSRPALLAMELGADSFQPVKVLCEQEPLITRIENIKDYSGYDRVILGFIK